LIEYSNIHSSLNVIAFNDIIQAMDDKTTSSEDLMARAAEGDEYAFEILVRKHQASVLNLIYRFIGNQAQAKDLAQDVFIRVWQAAKSYEPKAKFSTWIYRITANLCLNELKSTARKKLIPYFPGKEGKEGGVETIPDASPSVEDRLLAEEHNRQISDALQSLPENQRMALILKKYDDLSYQEIAQILGCSISAVESLLVRAKKNLYEKLISREK
jgi:RNA polymerase sigma-70 factor, ECF subfamily